ncbi:MAG: MFS transporter, partial [Myxococcota bacterium]
FFYAYGFGKLCNGFLADHASARRFIPLGLLLSAVVNLLFGLQSVALVSMVLWGLNGWFQGFLAPSCIVSLTQWFSSRERGTCYGIWNASHSIGEGITFAFTSSLVAWTMWRSAFLAPAALCAGAAAVLLSTLRDRPESEGLPSVEKWRDTRSSPQRAAAPEDVPLQERLRFQTRLLLMPAVWICGLASACMYVTRYAVNSWGMLYLQEEHGFALETAGLLIAINTGFGLFGSFCYGYLSDRFFASRRPPVTLLFGILECASLGLIFFSPQGSVLLLGVGYALYGFTLSGLLAVLGGLFAVDMEPRAAGAAMGVVGVFSYLGAAAQELLSGVLVERGTTMVDGVRHYDFSAPVALWVGASVASLVLAATLWRVKTSA